MMRSVATCVVGAALLLAGQTRGADVLAHYTFDSDYTDTTGNHNASPTGTTSGSTVSVTTANKAFGAGAASILNTGTSNDYLSIASPITIATNTPFAVSFWARPTDPAAANNTGGMITGDPSNAQTFFWIDEAVNPSGGLRFRSVGNANANFGPLNTWKDGNFHNYIVQIFDGNNDGNVNDVALYYDGSLLGTVNNIADTAFKFASIGQAYTSASFAYQGQIDELYILSGTLTSAERTSLYTSNTVPEPGTAMLLVGALPLMLMRRRKRRA